VGSSPALLYLLPKKGVSYPLSFVVQLERTNMTIQQRAASVLWLAIAVGYGGMASGTAGRYHRVCRKGGSIRIPPKPWTLRVNADRIATLSCDDGNGRISKPIEYADFPLEDVALYFTNNVILPTPPSRWIDVTSSLKSSKSPRSDSRCWIFFVEESWLSR
jgi:hypothetical protein